MANVLTGPSFDDSSNLNGAQVEDYRQDAENFRTEKVEKFRAALEQFRIASERTQASPSGDIELYRAQIALYWDLLDRYYRNGGMAAYRAAIDDYKSAARGRIVVP